MDWSSIRSEFPALDGIAYLNTATFGQLPRRATEAVAAHFAHRDRLACADFLTWFDDADRIRGKAARLVNADAADVAFVPNAATALSLLVRGMTWREGDQMVTLTNEFPNNLYSPLLLGQHGVELLQVPWSRFYDSLTARTRLVALSTVSYSSGFRPPMEEVAQTLRARGIPLYLDGTQSVGALQFDWRRIRPAMFAVHGYKWLLSPNGAAFMVVPPETREWLMPNVVGWRSDRDWRNVNALNHGLPTLPEAAERYEGGMLAFALLYAMEASLDLLLEVGPATIERRVLDLAAQCRSLLRALGADVPDTGSPILAARFPDRDPAALASALRASGVHVSARHGRLRVSTHFYNDESDLERLAAGL